MRGGEIFRKTLAVILALTIAVPVNLVPAMAAQGQASVKHEAPEEYIPGFRINLKAQIEDKAGVMLARCYFRTEQDDTFVFVDMISAGKDYQATLPAPWLNSGSIEYLFVVVSSEKRVTRSESFRIREKKTKEAKKWKDINDVPEIRVDRAQELYEKYAFFKKELVDRYKDKLEQWQDAFERGKVDIKTELKKADIRLRGFFDEVEVIEVPPELAYGFSAEGVYSQSQIASAGGAGATGATSAGAVSAAAGGGLPWGWIGLGAVAAGAGIAYGSGALDDVIDPSKDVKDAQPKDFVGTYDATDPNRSDGYRATFTFNDGGTGSFSESVSGFSNSGSLNWSFNPDTDVFSFGVPGGGSASGTVTGTVKDFTMTGRYANGSALTFHMVRR